MSAVHPLVECREKLGKKRKVDRITQEELGDLVGVDGMTVSRWERGESLPRRRFWPKLEKLTGRPIAEIIAAAKPMRVAAE